MSSIDFKIQSFFGVLEEQILKFIIPQVLNYSTTPVRSKGSLIYDISDNKIYYSNGTTWLNIVAGSVPDPLIVNNLIVNVLTQSATYTSTGGNLILTSPTTITTIGGTAITDARWPYVSTMNQNVATTSTPTFTGLSAGSQKITSVATPTVGTDAANKDYVDAAILAASSHPLLQASFATTSALPNSPTYTTTTQTLTSTAGAGTALVVNGITMVLAYQGYRILVKDQTDNRENGIYTLTSYGGGASAWQLTRATDFNQSVCPIPANSSVFIAIGVGNGTMQGTSWATEYIATQLDPLSSSVVWVQTSAFIYPTVQQQSEYNVYYYTFQSDLYTEQLFAPASAGAVLNGGTLTPSSINSLSIYSGIAAAPIGYSFASMFPKSGINYRAVRQIFDFNIKYGTITAATQQAISIIGGITPVQSIVMGYDFDTQFKIWNSYTQVEYWTLTINSSTGVAGTYTLTLNSIPIGPVAYPINANSQTGRNFIAGFITQQNYAPYGFAAFTLPGGQVLFKSFYPGVLGGSFSYTATTSTGSFVQTVAGINNTTTLSVPINVSLFIPTFVGTTFNRYRIVVSRSNIVYYIWDPSTSQFVQVYIQTTSTNLNSLSLLPSVVSVSGFTGLSATATLDSISLSYVQPTFVSPYPAYSIIAPVKVLANAIDTPVIIFTLNQLGIGNYAKNAVFTSISCSNDSTAAQPVNIRIWGVVSSVGNNTFTNFFQPVSAGNGSFVYYDTTATTFVATKLITSFYNEAGNALFIDLTSKNIRLDSYDYIVVSGFVSRAGTNQNIIMTWYETL